MSDYRRMRKHYNEVFDQLKYQNKVSFNQVSDYIKQKKLNRLSQQQILAELQIWFWTIKAEMSQSTRCLETTGMRFVTGFAKKLPRRSRQKSSLRWSGMSAVSLLVSIITIIVGLADRSGIYLSGLRALQIAGGVILVIIYLPLACYRDALHMPNNLVIPGPDDNAVKKNRMPLMILYSMVCIAGVVLYLIYFWIYPDMLKTSGLAAIRLNILVWVLASAIIFIASWLGEIQTVTNNYRRECGMTH